MRVLFALGTVLPKISQGKWVRITNFHDNFFWSFNYLPLRLPVDVNNVIGKCIILIALSIIVIISDIILYNWRIKKLQINIS